MNESLANVVVARLKQDGQMSSEQLASSIGSTDTTELDRTLATMLSSGMVKRSPRGSYYVQGHITPAASVRRPVRASGSAIVEFGVRSKSGLAFSFDGHVVLPGDCLTNRELIEVFGVGIMRGIRVSKSTGAVLLISSVDNALYRDAWQDGVFRYTGEGRKGDQTMTGGNLAIADSPLSGSPLLLFFKRATNQYEFQGEVRLAGEPVVEQQPDDDGQLRRVWVFLLEICD